MPRDEGQSDPDESLRRRLRRRRLQARGFALLWGVAVLVTGLPLSAVLTPFLFFCAMLGGRALELLVPLPAAYWSGLAAFADLVPAAIDTLFVDDFSLFAFLVAVLEALPVLVPGLIAMAVLAWRLQSVTSRSGAETVAAHLDARPATEVPGADGLLELVDRLARISGIPAPRVLLIDAPYPNGAALGGPPPDDTLLVTRGLLSQFEDDELRGALAHLIVSLGSGDGRLALVAQSVFQSFGLVLTALEACANLSRSAWQDMATTVRSLLRGQPPSPELGIRLLQLTKRRQDGLVSILEEASIGAPRSKAAHALRRHRLLWALFLPLIPVLVVLLLTRFALGVLRSFFVEPLVMLVWRSRRLQADALAVELTQDPDGLARALRALADRGTAPGGATLSDLFLVGSEAVTARAQAELHEALVRARKETGEGQPWKQVAASVEAHRQASREYLDAVAAAEAETPGWRILGPRPPLASRLARLRALGARQQVPDRRTERRRRWLAFLVLVPLTAVSTPPIAFIVSMTLLLGGGAAMLVAGGGMRLVELLFGA